MKKFKLAIAGISVTALVLTGCGTTEDETTDENVPAQTEESESTSGNVEENAPESDVVDNPETDNESTDNESTDQETTTEIESADQETGDTDPAAKTDESTLEPTEDEKDETVRLLEQPLKYSLKGEEKSETAFLKNSDNQSYSLYVLPEFELSSEEPRKDVLFLTGQDEIFMRIEVLSNDVNWADTEENVKTQLAAISDTVNSVDPSKYGLKNAVMYEAVSGNDTVTSVLLKDETQPVRLTIFTTGEQDYRDAFIEMGKTILVTE